MGALSSPTPRLRLPARLWEGMRAHVSRLAPEEACGLVAGQGEHCLAVLPITNILHSPVRYRMAAEEQLQAFHLFEESGWELVAIYHSHPNGPPGPSETDIAEAFYPEALGLIWAREGESWLCRGFQIREGQAREIELVIEE